ncbi:PAS domain S-box protein [Robiginitalea sp. M366]|uniref:PAS domain S-box protein n=1 Tax=Robiginitalea aestuariiviva TaxID=3036903 RepID=UPI00240D4F84|nr:PAS domain S-box protein [Robiginitalea aestuariiviva]MDG1573372.1 PAS domain S-box protein [Robiginitalea aestuariiviva]
MAENRIEILERALERQKKARRQAESILEVKSRELFDTARQLKEANEQLEGLLSEKTAELQGIFVNIVDPYVVMDTYGNVIRMNSAAKEFLGFDHAKNPKNLTELVHPDYEQYTRDSLRQLFRDGFLKNYVARIQVAPGHEPFVQINGSVIYDRDNKPVAAQGIIRDITREREAADLIREQKQQLDIIVDHSPLGIVLTVDGQIIKANHAFEVLTGYPHQEVIGKKLASLSTPEDPDLGARLEREMARGTRDTYHLVKRYVRADGRNILAKATVSAVRDKNGKEVYRVKILEDITRQREAELKIHASESRLSNLIENLNTAVLLEDQDRKIALTNQQFCDIFGITAPPESLKGYDCDTAARQSMGLFEDENGFLDRIDEILKARELVHGEELLLKDGRILERDYIPIYSDEHYQGHLWTYSDVTLPRLYKQTIEQERNKYGSIIANMNLGMIEVDLDDTIQMVNKRFSQMSGYGETELLGQTATEILRVSNKEIIPEMLERRKKGYSDSYEVEVATKKGERKYWLVSGAPRYDEKGRLAGTIGIHLDVTMQKELEAQKELLLKELQASNRELSEYAHIVSHDLKSPLRSVNALVSWMQEDYRDKLGPEGQLQLQMMQDKIEGMDHLIDDILRYSSIQQDAAAQEEVDLNQVVSNIREIIFIPDHVRIVIMDELPVIRAIPAQMHQLFQNLLSNAVTHIENPEGLVTVGCRDIGDFWEFYVEDNGVGIPPEYHQKIFQMFQSISGKRKGTGIGLSIVKKITELHGGEVRVASTPGQGTTFTFTIRKQ